jgi:hypothetical protein
MFKKNVTKTSFIIQIDNENTFNQAVSRYVKTLLKTLPIKVATWRSLEKSKDPWLSVPASQQVWQLNRQLYLVDS